MFLPEIELPFLGNLADCTVPASVQVVTRDIIIIIISIQPEGRLWQEPEPSQATGMALVHCILGSFLGVGCHCFPPPLDVPTFRL